MRNWWLVAKHAYLVTVVRRGFIIGTLAVPVGIAVFIAVIILVETSGENRQPVGYVDHSGLLDPSRQAQLPADDDRIEIRAYSNEADALDALEGGQIQAFFVFPSNYRETLRTELYYPDQPPSGDVWGQFDDFVRVNLVADLPADVQARLLAGPEITVVDLTSGRTFSERGMINIILPVAASALFFFTTLSASGYLLRVVADEKENQTMEVMLTSLTPGQLIGGKSIGLLAAVLTQVAVYAIGAVIGLLVAGRYVPELREAVVPWDYLGVMALFFLPSFGLLTAVMVAIGSAVPDVQQGQQIAGLLNLSFMAPLILTSVVMSNPSHPAVLFLTLFPTSAFLTISLRWGLSVVPIWQLAASWTLLIGTTLLLAWAAARVFRMGMLSYGQPLTLRLAWAAIRGK